MQHHAILFLCTHNTIRSVMAEYLMRANFGKTLYVVSAGLEPVEPDPFTKTVLAELGIDTSEHTPKHVDDVIEDNYDLVIALSKSTFELVRKLHKEHALDVEYWSLPLPPVQDGGSRDQILDSYRRIRDEVNKHILNRFGENSIDETDIALET